MVVKGEGVWGKRKQNLGAETGILCGVHLNKGDGDDIYHLKVRFNVEDFLFLRME